MAALTAQRVISLYDVMHSAYDANEIHAHSRSLAPRFANCTTRLGGAADSRVRAGHFAALRQTP